MITASEVKCQECKGTERVSFLPKGAAPSDHSTMHCLNPTRKNGMVYPDLARRQRNQIQYYGIPLSGIPAHILPDLE